MTKNKIREIKDAKKVIAIYFPSNMRVSGIQFLTPKSYPMQIGIHNHKKGKVVPAHFHPHLKYNVVNTQEFLYVAKGVVEMKIFTKNWKKKAHLRLTKGDSVLIVNAGHEVNLRPGCRVIEVKQGPYPGDKKSKIFRDPPPLLPR